MIKAINAIIFSIVAALGVMLVYNLTDSYVRTQYLEERGTEELVAGNYDFFVPLRFYNDTPIVDIVVNQDDKSFRVMIYDGAYVRLIDEDLVVSSGIFLLIHQTKGETLPDFFGVKLSASDIITVEQLGVKLFSLPLYSTVDEQSKRPIFNKDEFIIDDVFQEITKIEILEKDVLVMTIPILIQESDLGIKAELQNYIDREGSVPTEPFGSVSISPIIRIDSSALVIRNIAIYAVFAFGLTVLFFKARKKLGRKEPTKGLKKDIEKIKK